MCQSYDSAPNYFLHFYFIFLRRGGHIRSLSEFLIWYRRSSLCLFSPSIPCWNQAGAAPALIKAEVPWSARRGSLSDKDRVLKTVKGYLFYPLLGMISSVGASRALTLSPLLRSILNKLTPEKFDVLKGQLIESGITTPDILEVV